VKKLLFVIVLFIFPIIGFAQEIFISKDSLNLYQDSISLDIIDSLYIKNIGSADLIIDSIKVNHGYGYRVNIKLPDSTLDFILINFEPTEKITVNPQDSIQVFFSNPDLCPICKTNRLEEFFTDSVTFHSNSINNPKYIVLIQGDGYTDVNESKKNPEEFRLFQNYPNPFNPTTTIKYSVPSPFVMLNSFQHLDKETPKQVRGDKVDIRLIIYDVLGKEIATLVNERQKSGTYQVTFDASNISSGVYYYQLKVGSFIETKKMILLR